MQDPNEIAKLKARIMLMEQSMAGMEALVIHILERDIKKHNPLAWTQPVIPQA